MRIGWGGRPGSVSSYNIFRTIMVNIDLVNDHKYHSDFQRRRSSCCGLLRMRPKVRYVTQTQTVTIDVDRLSARDPGHAGEPGATHWITGFAHYIVI